MRVVGFSIIRNAIQYDYPIVEAIRSILPICDEVVVAVGRSEDETLSMVKNIDPKVRVLETIWNEDLRKSGAVLAEETDKAFDAIKEADWCFYIQADEVLHEQFHTPLLAAMRQNLPDEKVEGLLFDYIHFYGSYDFIGDSRKWYRKEIRVIRNDKLIRSFQDAQGFRKEGRKLKVKPADAFIYHYGWVKHPKHQQLKQKSFNKYWHDDDWMKEHIPDVEEFNYDRIDSLQHFKGTHPEVMKARIEQMNWHFTFDPTQRKLSLKERFSRLVERATGIRLGEYQNYQLLK